jgi:hypothetical protein
MKEVGIPAAVVMELVSHDSEAISRHYTHGMPLIRANFGGRIPTFVPTDATFSV